MEELRSNGINIYNFPTDDETVADLNSRMNDQIPFAVVGSREEIVVNGVKVRARKYPWGTVEGEASFHWKASTLLIFMLLYFQWKMKPIVTLLN